MSTTTEHITSFKKVTHDPRILSGNGQEAEVSRIDEILEPDLPLELKLVRTEEEFDEIEADWNELIDQPGVETTVFQSYDWQRTWWEHLSSGRELHIVTMWDKTSNQLVGIAPFSVESISFAGFFTFRKLQFTCSNIPGSRGLFSKYSPTDYLDIIVHPGYREKVIETFLSYLKRSRSYFDQIELDELSEEGVFMNMIDPQMSKGWDYKKTRGAACPQIQLPDSMDGYLGELDGKVRYQLRYAKRAVTEKELIRVFTVTEESEFDEAFQRFVDLHQKRWNNEGYPGIFADTQFRDFLSQSGKAFLKNGILKFTLAFDKQDNCIAVDYAFQFKNKVYDYQKGFDTESDLAKYSPGKALLYYLIDDAISDEMEVVDLLRGGEKYKLKVTTRTARNWKIQIPDPDQMHSVKYRLFRLHQSARDVKNRIEREIMLFRIHYNQWKGYGFISRYYSFMKNRIRQKIS